MNRRFGDPNWFDTLDRQLEEGQDIDFKMIENMFYEKYRDDKGNIAPSIFGADNFFINHFVTDDMDYEFNMIARDFMKHHFERLREFSEISWYDNDRCYQSDPNTSFQRKIFGIIYNAAKSGDEYSVKLIKHLYKNFHKKEYKQLKRFSKMNLSEVYTLNDGSDTTSFAVIARTLCMSQLYGIELEPRCCLLYEILDKEYDKSRSDGGDIYEFKDGLFRECLEQIEEWENEAQCDGDSIEDFIKKYQDFFELDRLIGKAMRHEGFPEDFIARCNNNFDGIKRLLARTLALLKTAYPRKDFTYEEVQRYARLIETIDGLVSICDTYEDNINELFGITDDKCVLDDEEPIFRPEDIVLSGANKKISSSEIKKIVNIAPVSTGNAGKEEYLAEIEELRRKLNEKERDFKNLRSQYEQIKIRESEQRILSEKYESEHDELIALRSALYEMSAVSEDALVSTSVSIDDMKNAVSDMKIVIIGGNDNWVKKIRQEFPEWKFISAYVSGAVNSMQLQNAERVYFFTDTLGHSNYYKFMQVVREHNVPFGYMHGVNIEKNITQVYKDMCSR